MSDFPASREARGRLGGCLVIVSRKARDYLSSIIYTIICNEGGLAERPITTRYAVVKQKLSLGVYAVCYMLQEL